MHKYLLVTCLAFLSSVVIAQNDNISASNVKSEATFKIAKKKKRYKYFSESAPVTMADGSTKSIADVKVGERVKTCRNGKSVTTEVKQIDVYTKPNSSLTAVYLRPAENVDSRGLIVPALLLEATPDHRVQTNRGRKRMKKLSKNDILYHYEPSTGIVSDWKVGAIQANARTVNKAYNLETEDGTYLIDNVMVTQ